MHCTSMEREFLAESVENIDITSISVYFLHLEFLRTGYNIGMKNKTKQVFITACQHPH